MTNQRAVVVEAIEGVDAVAGIEMAVSGHTGRKVRDGQRAL